MENTDGTGGEHTLISRGDKCGLGAMAGSSVTPLTCTAAFQKRERKRNAAPGPCATEEAN